MWHVDEEDNSRWGLELLVDKVEKVQVVGWESEQEVQKVEFWVAVAYWQDEETGA